MKILALDLGTKTGYCFGSEAVSLVAGTWELANAREITNWGESRRDRRRDPRPGRLYDRLDDFRLVDLVVFEDVEFSSYTKQTQLWSSLRTAIWLTPFLSTTRFECVPVTTLKKFATGHGGATKEMMRKALWKYNDLGRKLPETLDDNAVDAIWIWLWAKHNLSRIKV